MAGRLHLIHFLLTVRKNTTFTRNMHKEWGTGLDGNSKTKLNPALYPIKLTPEMDTTGTRSLSRNYRETGQGARRRQFLALGRRVHLFQYQVQFIRPITESTCYTYTVDFSTCSISKLAPFRGAYLIVPLERLVQKLWMPAQ